MKSEYPPWPAQGATLKTALWPVILLTTIFLVNFITRQLAGPSLPAMEEEFSLSHTRSGLYILLMGTGFCLSQLGAPFLTARLGYRRCILLSLWATAAAAALVGASPSPLLLYPLFLVLGMAGGLYVPSGIALITVLVRSQDWGKAISIHELAPNLALITVPFLATAAVLAGSWRLGYFAIALATAVVGLLYLRCGIDSDRRPSPPSLAALRTILTQPSFWLISALISLAVGVETGIYAITPLFLVNERGFSLAEANLLLGASRLPGIVVVLFAGWITDKLSPHRAVRIALGVTGLAVIGLAVGPAWLLIVSIFLQAAASAALFPPMLSMVSAISDSAGRALTISLSIAVAPILGSGLLPAAIAFSGDHFSFSLGLLLTGIVILAGMGLARK